MQETYQCQECGREWIVGPDDFDTECPHCGSNDTKSIDIAY